MTGSGAWGRELAVYTALRVGLTIAIGVAAYSISGWLKVQMPLIVAALLAVIIQLPMAWLLFDARRRRVNDLLAQRAGRRRQQRERLRDELEGG